MEVPSAGKKRRETEKKEKDDCVSGGVCTVKRKTFEEDHSRPNHRTLPLTPPPPPFHLWCDANLSRLAWKREHLLRHRLDGNPAILACL
ncbi:unnamed protein product [Arctogadus glacialis]